MASCGLAGPILLSASLTTTEGGIPENGSLFSADRGQIAKQSAFDGLLVSVTRELAVNHHHPPPVPESEACILDRGRVAGRHTSAQASWPRLLAQVRQTVVSNAVNLAGNASSYQGTARCCSTQLSSRGAFGPSAQGRRATTQPGSIYLCGTSAL